MGAIEADPGVPDLARTRDDHRAKAGGDVPDAGATVTARRDQERPVRRERGGRDDSAMLLQVMGEIARLHLPDSSDPIPTCRGHEASVRAESNAGHGLFVPEQTEEAARCRIEHLGAPVVPSGDDNVCRRGQGSCEHRSAVAVRDAVVWRRPEPCRSIFAPTQNAVSRSVEGCTEDGPLMRERLGGLTCYRPDADASVETGRNDVRSASVEFGACHGPVVPQHDRFRSCDEVVDTSGPVRTRRKDAASCRG